MKSYGVVGIPSWFSLETCWIEGTTKSVSSVAGYATHAYPCKHHAEAYTTLPHVTAIVRLLRFLDAEARLHGGAVYMLNGNHESLNICGDFRYAASEPLLLCSQIRI